MEIFWFLYACVAGGVAIGTHISATDMKEWREFCPSTTTRASLLILAGLFWPGFIAAIVTTKLLEWRAGP